jgi:hypothetical protein
MSISDEMLAVILRGTEGVTPGPWYQTGEPWFQGGDGVLAGSPDGNIAYLLADLDDGFNPRDEYTGPFDLGDKDADAAHIARCSPEIIAAMATELLERRRSPAGEGVGVIPHVLREPYPADDEGRDPHAGPPPSAEFRRGWNELRRKLLTHHFVPSPDRYREGLEAAAKVVDGWTVATNSRHLQAWGPYTAAIVNMLTKRDEEIAAAIRSLAQGESK